MDGFKTTPVPILALNSRKSNTLILEGHGKADLKKNKETIYQVALRNTEPG